MATVSVIEQGAHESATLRLVLTGAAAAVCRVDATRLPLARLDAALLALLAIEGATPRQRLLQLLWPDDEPEKARNVLRQRLFRLRRAVGADLVAGAELLALAAGVTHDIDGDGNRGELLAVHDFSDCGPFESWLDEQRSALAVRRRERDRAHLDACERDARYAEGAALAERLVAADALDEAAVQWLMRLRYLDGQRAAAVAAFDRFESALHADHGGVPAHATTELLATIRTALAPSPVPPAARCAIPASVLRPPRLIGREAERARLHAPWSAERVFWLLGEAGLGKTRLISEFVAEFVAGACDASDAAAKQRVPAPPGDVLVVHARPGDAGVPYASLGRALRALIERRPLLLDGAQRGELVRVLPEIDRAAVARVGLGQQLMLQGAIEALLRDAQRAGLGGIVIDDLHFADSASLEMLQGLVPLDGLSALRWGFAQRPAEGAAAVEALRITLEEAQRVEVVALAPLDEAQIAELVGSLGLAGIDAVKLAPLLARHTGGNPMYALETLKHLIADDRHMLDGKLPRPVSVGQLIERRLRQLSPQALALARVAAVAGVDFSIELAEAVLDTRALALADAWHELEAAQVLRANAFAHDLVHEAALAGLPAPIAAHTHGAVAAFVEAHGGEPARVAAHWLAAAQPQRGLAALHAAADAAKRAMRRKEEAGFLARAAQIESESGDAAAFGSWHAMIEALWVVDLAALDAALFDRFEAAAATPSQRANARALRANWLQQCGDLDEAKRLARSAVELADAAGDEPTAAYARVRLAEILDFGGDDAAALELLQPLLGWAAERASGHEQAEFYCRLALALDNAGRGRDARVYHRRTIELSREAREWGDLVTLLGNLAISWATAGYMQRSVDVLREALQIAAAHDEARGCGVALPGEMYRSLRDCGHYAEALRWVEPALAAEPGVRAALMHCNVACGWIYLGQHARAQREIDAAMKAQVPGWMRARILQMRARLKLALGQSGAAAALADEALQTVLAQTGRRALRASITLDQALWLEPSAALEAARGVIAEGERLDLPGTALAGHIRAMRFAVQAASASDAAAHAAAALAIGDDVSPYGMYPAERWLNAWRALQLAGRDGEANEVLRRGVEWVKHTMQTHVPEPFRDSFGRANAVNQQLLRAAAALG